MLTELDITTEKWREYDFGGRVYRIDNPVRLYLRAGGTTHRVLDENGIVHCIPSVGEHGCAIRWQPRNKKKPVDF